MSYEYTVSIPNGMSRKLRAAIKAVGGTVSRGKKKMSAYEQSMEDLKCGRVKRFESVEELFADLNA